MISPQTARYRAALSRPHAAYSRVEVWRSGTLLEELSQRQSASVSSRARVFLAGSVRITLNSRVARTLSMSIPEYMYPYKPDDLLNPYGDELRCYRGIRYGDGSLDEFPVFRGPVLSVSPTGGGTATLRAADLASLVLAVGFSAPTASSAGDSVIDEFERIIRAALPDAEFGEHSEITETVPQLAYDTDRGAALDGLAKVAGAFWYPLADGRFVIRHVPWTRPAPGQAVIMGAGSEDLPDGATVLSAYPERSSEGIYSRITVTSERVDGSGPLWATVDDTDPDSPTYVGGPFGVRSATVRVTQAANQGAVHVAAQTLLRRARGLVEPWRISCVPDGSLELGDAVLLRYRGVEALQCVASMSMPLESAAPMAVDGRAYVTGQVEL